MWRLLKGAPQCFLSLIFPWRRSPPTESICLAPRDVPGMALPHFDDHEVYAALSRTLPITLSPPPTVSSSGDLPSPETHVTEAQPSRPKTRDSRGPSTLPPFRGWRTPSFRGWKNPKIFPSRFRALLRPVVHHHRRYPRRASSYDADDGGGGGDVLLISMTELSSIEPLQTDDDADDWEDVETRTVRMLP